jgi:hypothetical protein
MLPASGTGGIGDDTNQLLGWVLFTMLSVLATLCTGFVIRNRRREA